MTPTKQRIPETIGPVEAGRDNGLSHDNEEGEAPRILDVLGIGFGPANLSLAIAVEEYNAQRAATEGLTAGFIESQSTFAWHDGMLLPDTDMQISFLKDLVSLRNPVSDYTFLHYLHQHGRLSDFINLKTFFPSRKEFHDYLSWAAAKVDFPVHYGSEATRIEWTGNYYEVTVQPTSTQMQGHSSTIFRARDIVLGIGLQAALPEWVTPSTRVFHNHKLLHRLPEITSRKSKRFVVVGSGQSAAEVACYLHEHYPDAEVHASFRRFGYTPSDDTPYANRIFDPAAVNDFFDAPEGVKEKLLHQHWLTNYSAVDADLIETLYRREYEERLADDRRLFVHRVTEVDDVTEHADGVTVTLNCATSGDTTTIEADAVIFATGFRPHDLRTMLGTSIDTRGAFESSQPVVDRDYRLSLPSDHGRIFLNGGVEHSHGISSSLLSNVSVRAADILATFHERTPAPKSLTS